MPINLSYSTSKLEYPGSSNEVSYRAKAQENEAVFNAAQQRNQLLIQGMNQLEQRKVANETSSDVLLEAIGKSDLLEEYDDTAKVALQGYKTRINNFLNNGDIYNSGEAIRKISRDMKSDISINTAIANSANIRQFDGLVASNPKYDQVTKDYYFGIHRKALLDGSTDGKEVNSRIDIKDLYGMEFPESIDVMPDILNVLRQSIPNVDEKFVKTLLSTDNKELLSRYNIPEELMAYQGVKTTDLYDAKIRLQEYLSNPATKIGAYFTTLANYQTELATVDDKYQPTTAKDIANSYLTGLDFYGETRNSPNLYELAASMYSKAAGQNGNKDMFVASTSVPEQVTRKVFGAMTPTQYQMAKGSYMFDLANEFNNSPNLPDSTKTEISTLIQNNNVEGLRGVLDKVESGVIPVSSKFHGVLNAYIENIDRNTKITEETFGKGFKLDLENILLQSEDKTAKITGEDIFNEVLNLSESDRSIVSKIVSEYETLARNAYSSLKTEGITDIIKKYDKDGILYGDSKLGTFLYSLSALDEYDKQNQSPVKELLPYLPILPDVMNNQLPERKAALSKLQSVSNIVKSTTNKYNEYIKNYEKETASQVDLSSATLFKEESRNQDAANYITEMIKGRDQSKDEKGVVFEQNKVFDTKGNEVPISNSTASLTPDRIAYKGVIPLNGKVYYSYRTTDKTNKVESDDLYLINVPDDQLTYSNLSETGKVSQYAERLMFLKDMDNLATRSESPINLNNALAGLNKDVWFYSKVGSDNKITYYLSEEYDGRTQIKPFSSLYQLENSLYNAISKLRNK